MFYVLPKEEFPKIREFIHYFRATAKTPFALEDMVENMIQGKKSTARKAPAKKAEPKAEAEVAPKAEKPAPKKAPAKKTTAKK